MILNSIQAALPFLPSVNLKIDNKRLNSFFENEQAWLAEHVIGDDIEDLLEIEVTNTDPHAELRKLVQCVIANRAFAVAIPELDVQLTEAGFAVQENDNFKPASSQRVDRLLAKMPSRIALGLDALVRYLLENSKAEGVYSDWRGTPQFAYLSATFMPMLEDYKRNAGAHPIENWDDFYSAISVMAHEMRHMADYYVSIEEIDRLAELYRDDELVEVQRKAIDCLCQCAVACYAHDIRRARNAASRAHKIMMANTALFPAFANSDAFVESTLNLDGGNVVNLL